MAQVAPEIETKIVVDLTEARRAVRKIFALAKEANAELARAEDALAIQEQRLDAHVARLQELGISYEK
jgi:hypothetical protein